MTSLRAALPLFALVLVSAIWGAHAVVGAQVIAVLSPLTLTVWRFTFGALLFSPALPGALRRVRILRVQDRLALPVAALLWAVFYPLFYYRSLRILPPVESLLLVNGAPVIAAFLAFVFFRERLRGRQILGLVVAFAGVFVITVQAQGRGGQDLGALVDALIGTVSFAVYTVLSRSLFARLRLFDVLAWTTLIGALALWATAIVMRQAPVVIHEFFHLRGDEWYQFAFIAFAVSGFAYVLYGYGLARTQTALASALTFYPQAFFAAGLQWLTLGLLPTSGVVAGGAIILLGTFLLQWKPRPRSSS